MKDLKRMCCKKDDSPIQKAIDYLEKLKKSEALNDQVGGRHYKKFLIQPFIFHRANGLKQAEANVIDYILRAPDKNGKEDLKKAIHYIEMIIDTDYS